MKTGTFAIDYMQAGFLSIGSAELTTGFLGEILAHLRVLAPDGEYYSEYWLRADPVDRRIEYLYYEEVEGGVVRGGEWPIQDVEEWLPDNDEDLMTTFTEMARAASDLEITPLQVGSDIETLGGPLGQEDLDALGLLWAPAADEP